LENPVVTLPGTEAAEIKLLKETVSKYFTAWAQKDFKTMRSLEDWTGDKELNEVEYIQSFRKDFKVYTWKITKVSSLPANRYLALVLITHNPPQNILAHLPTGKTISVRSTLPKLWEKKGDKFVHLFHIEHQKMMAAFPDEPPVPMQSPVPATPFPTESAPKTLESTPATPEATPSNKEQGTE
jgi:hypothetical protein